MFSSPLCLSQGEGNAPLCRKLCFLSQGEGNAGRAPDELRVHEVRVLVEPALGGGELRDAHVVPEYPVLGRPAGLAGHRLEVVAEERELRGTNPLSVAARHAGGVVRLRERRTEGADREAGQA